MTRIPFPCFAVDFDSYVAALEAAVEQGFVLNTYGDPTTDGHDDVSLEYAAKVASEDSSLVYLTTNRVWMADGNQGPPKRPGITGGPFWAGGPTGLAARRVDDGREPLWWLC